MSKIMYSVVVPVYNSTTSLTELVERLCRVFEDTVKESWEVILVDDASPNPESWQTMQTLAGRYEQIMIVQLMRNFGKTGAVLCGFEQAQGQYVITLDDDLQHYPEDIPEFVRLRSHDVVIGTFPQKKHGFFKSLTSDIKSWFDQMLLKKPRHVKVGPFKLYKRCVVKAMLQIKTPYPFITALLFYATQDVVTVDIRHAARKYGRSDYNFIRRLKNFSNLLINNSSFLLRIVSIVGVSVSIISFLAGIYITIRNLLYDIPVPGWTSLFVVMTITNGLMLFSIGVIGEYLIRMLRGIESRPAFIVREIYQKKPDQ